MKKNEKNFMQNEADLEKVAGGAMASGVGVETDVNFKARDITGVGVNTTKDNSTNNSGNNVGYKDLSVRGKGATFSVGGDINFN